MFSERFFVLIFMIAAFTIIYPVWILELFFIGDGCKDVIWFAYFGESFHVMIQVWRVRKNPKSFSPPLWLRYIRESWFYSGWGWLAFSCSISGLVSSLLLRRHNLIFGVLGWVQIVVSWTQYLENKLLSTLFRAQLQGNGFLYPWTPCLIISLPSNWSRRPLDCGSYTNYNG